MENTQVWREEEIDGRRKGDSSTISDSKFKRGTKEIYRDNAYDDGDDDGGNSLKYKSLSR